MPKKGKKSKKDKKGKGKGKKKADEKEESIAKMAVRNSNLWESRLKMVEFQKDHYRDTSKQLVEENTSLVDYMHQTEKDTIEVVAYLRKLDADKEQDIASLQYELKNIQGIHQAEKDAIISEYSEQINDLEERLSVKTNEATLLQNELTQLKEFRKKKVQMQRELEEIKDAMIMNEKEHKDHISRIEQKFFEEKMRLQIEANKKIEELAEKAHDAAVRNLNDITRNIYKENVQLAESFKLNGEEIEMLRKKCARLSADNEQLRGANSDNGGLLREKVESAAKQAKTIKELSGKVEVLEKSLAQAIREFEVERTQIIARCKNEVASNGIELEKLQKMMELKGRETAKIKKLAKNILSQRSEIERFFLESLDYVRRQIVANRADYRKEANLIYNSKMLAAHLGHMDYPKIRTFTKKFDANSTNNVYKDLEQAEKWIDMSELIDLGDLTWEQKEQVLRQLFARINGAKAASNKATTGAITDGNSKLALNDKYEDDDFTDDIDAESMQYLEQRRLSKNASGVQGKSTVSDFGTFITQSSAQADEIFMAKSVQPDSANSAVKLPLIK